MAGSEVSRWVQGEVVWRGARCVGGYKERLCGGERGESVGTRRGCVAGSEVSRWVHGEVVWRGAR